MKQQLFVTHTILQTEIPALLDGSVTNTPSVIMLCPHIACTYISAKPGEDAHGDHGLGSW